MTRSFNSIEAVMFALRFIGQAFVTFLRLGWMGLGVMIAGWALIVESGGSVSLGGMTFGTRAKEGVIEAGFSQSAGVFMTFGQSLLLSTVGIVVILIGFLLLVPAATAVVRRAAGAEPRSGFLPRFGAHEISFLLANLIILGVIAIASIFIAVSAVLGLGFYFSGGAQVLQDLDATGMTIVLLMFLALAASLWVVIRFSLFPVHAAVTGRLSVGEGWRLTKGRFWKLFLTYVLLQIVFFAIELGLGFLGIALIAVGLTLVSALLSLALQLASQLASMNLASDIFRQMENSHPE
jgi:hypothetical protein